METTANVSSDLEAGDADCANRSVPALIGHNVALWVADDQFFAAPAIVQFNDLGMPA